MCSEVEVIRGEQIIECATHGALADALGLIVDQIPQTYLILRPVERNDCLCNADVIALGGRKATDAEGWPFPEWVIDLPLVGMSP